MPMRSSFKSGEVISSSGRATDGGVSYPPRKLALVADELACEPPPFVSAAVCP